MSVTFLATGFEPFAEHRINSSWEALARLRERWSERDVVMLRLPVDHVAAHEALRRALNEHRPRAVLCTGLCRYGFQFERWARRPRALAHVDGDPTLEGSWPWQELRDELARTGVLACESWDAGQYVCESTYWSLLAFRAQHRYPEHAAFLHVPPLSREEPLERTADAVGRVIEARLRALRSSAAP